MDGSGSGMVVVGVTGRGREAAALAFAAECARREGAEVLLVHAVREVLAPPPALLTVDELAGVAEQVLAEVGEEFQRLSQHQVPFRTEARTGHPARVLVEASRGARLLVLQRQSARRLGRLFVGSTINGAAAHAECPVVSVPDGWEPGRAVAQVVVGVHGGGEPPQAIEAGLAWAAATGASLRVVHGWRLDPAYDDIITGRVARDWERGVEEQLGAVLEELRRDHPDVSVRTEVRHQQGSQALVDLSEKAALVVVRRHAAHRPWGERLGSHARAVMRAADAPVMVVPVSPA